ncbi:phenylacetate-CoA oxygenase subunit PaaC [Flavobacteriales bacterium]|jgi:ring-1,2-phenylacetyl-CoA epoxidase subunit PaaC|nr:phenylacetate-CoA oxygenase subunit PaaC [Flavobacteriales bacterium]
MEGNDSSWLLWLADDALILGQRLSEWCGHGPVLEEDIALSNVALDLIGQARALLTLAGQREAKGRDEDQLAFFRTDRAFRNLLLVELPNGDFGDTIARQFLFDQFALLRYEALAQQTTDFELAAIAAKAVKEVRYHAAHSAKWIVRLGDGTDESKVRIQGSIDRLWEYTGEFFMDYGMDSQWADTGILPPLASFEMSWLKAVQDVLAEATLESPSADWMQKGGRMGEHTEHLSFLLAEMQVLPRTYPDAQW